ncbi:histidine phosphatase family protein [Pseudonocardia nantongensis]|uniref:histidine phosphatase family protein n=1 Tax=Pseudonocardia nantongensis TaxID=1181885 RepID=UPI00397B4ABE
MSERAGEPVGRDPATAFAAVGSGARSAQVPPDDGAFRLVLVRHGRTPSNVRHALDTALPGPSLDELGRSQAEEVAGLLSGWPVRAVHASHATRARETAEPVAARLGLRVELLPGVHEVFVGDLDGRVDGPARDEFDAIFASWWDGDPDRRMPGGESARDLWGRFLPDLARVSGTPDAADSGAVVVVSHGAAIRLASLALLGGEDGSGPARPDARDGRNRPVPNTGRVVLRRDPDGWTTELWDPMPDQTRSNH